MPKVSIVMPAYNAEKYIGLAFDSLINQTFSDWECIVVDDVSTDGTLEIVKQYTLREPRIKYKALKRNSGGRPKIPRDVAVAMASSEWIMILDSDDTIANDVIEKLFSRQIETGADIVLPRMVATDEDGNTKGFHAPQADFDFSQIITGLEAASLTIGRWIIGANGGIYSKRIYDNRSYPEDFIVEYNADEYDTRQMLIMANKVAFVDVYYYYRCHFNSVTKSINMNRFKILYTDKFLQGLIESEYDHNDKVIEMMKLQRCEGVLGCRLLLLRNAGKLAKDDYLWTEQLIVENYKDVSRYDICWGNDFRSKMKQYLFEGNYILFRFATYIASKLRRV